MSEVSVVFTKMAFVFFIMLVIGILADKGNKLEEKPWYGPFELLMSTCIILTIYNFLMMVIML